MADPSRRFYRAFGLGRGGVWELFGPKVWARGVQAMLKGNLGGPPVGDPWTMPGLLLVSGDAIIWEHRYRHAGEHPDFARIVAHVLPRG